MQKFSILVCAFLLLAPLGLQAQKSLSLEDAVMQQWRKFRPEHLRVAQWREDGKGFTQSGPRYQEVFYYEGKKAPKSLFSTKDLQAAFGEQVPYIANFGYLSKTEIFLSFGQAYYRYDYKSKKGKKWVAYPQEAANLAFHEETGRLAYTIDNNIYLATEQEEKTAVTRFNNPAIVSGQAIARSEFGISKGLFWSPNGQYLAFYQKDESEVSDYPLVDISSTPAKLRNIKYPMAGQASEKARVGVFDPASGQTVYLKIEGDEADQYLTNLGWGPKSEKIYLAQINRDQNAMRLNVYEAKTGKFIKTLFEEKHERYVEPEKAVWFLPNNPKEFLWASERDGFTHLYRYEAETGKLLNAVSKGNWEVEEILGLDSSGKSVICMGTDPSGLNLYAYKLSLDGKKQTQLTKEEGQHHCQLSPNGKWLLDEYSNISTPNVAQLISTKNGKLKREFIKAENPLKDYKVGTTELLTLKAADGTDLQARLIKPSDFDPKKKYPVIVYVYGGPHAQMVTNSWLGGASLWMQQQAEKGYLVFTLDNRGSANRGFDFESIIHRQLGEVEMQDQLVGVNYLKQQAFVDADRMAVHGWSFGGFMTTSLMLRQPGVFRVGVAGGPVTDWKFYEVMYGERYMDRPEQNPEGYAKNRLHNYVDQLQGELLLIHGSVDDVVVLQHNHSLIQAFVEAEKQVDYFVYPGHPHNVRGKDRVHLMRKVLQYIEDKLN